MLTEKEKIGIKKLLDGLQEIELLRLAQTVTNAMVIPENFYDALEAICSYGGQAESILNRKKVTRKLIFDYLRSENVQVSVNGGKREMVQATLEYWSSANQNLTRVGDMDDNNDGGEIEHAIRTPSNESNAVALDQNIEMALQFGNWFYSMLNSSSNIDSTFSASHFWTNCSLRVKINLDDVTTIEESNNVVHYLKNIIKNSNFNPNLTHDSVNIKSDRHGLNLIDISGTMNANGTCVGVFNQTFGLIRDPSSDNAWKIKFSNLAIKTNDSLYTNQGASIGYSSNEIMYNT